MAVDEIGPVPPGLVARTPASEVANTVEWANNLIQRAQRDATREKPGDVRMAAGVPLLEETISDPPTQLEVLANRVVLNELIRVLREAGLMETT